MPDDIVLLAAILEQARLIKQRMNTTSRQEFDADLFLQLAFDKLLQNIGESARIVSEAGRARVPALPWKQIVGMRHRLVHEYFRTDGELIWSTCHEPIDRLLEALNPIVGAILDRRKDKDE
ncbi:MAG: DUF86 domain-containing protein [Burkholderiales bacterium]|nr:DUF86 domain-containing protein [Phycisphaerae bacterium]